MPQPQGLQQATWPEAFAAIQKAAAGVKGGEMRAIAGKLADAGEARGQDRAGCAADSPRTQRLGAEGVPALWNRNRAGSTKPARTPSLATHPPHPAPSLPRVHGGAQGPVQPPGRRRPAGEAEGGGDTGSSGKEGGWMAELAHAPKSLELPITGSAALQGLLRLPANPPGSHLGCPPSTPHVQSEGGFPDFDADVRSNYLFNSSIAGIDSADAILLVRCMGAGSWLGRAVVLSWLKHNLSWGREKFNGKTCTATRRPLPAHPQIGTNPRIEAPVLNARIRAGACNGSAWFFGHVVTLCVGSSYLLCRHCICPSISVVRTCLTCPLCTFTFPLPLCSQPGGRARGRGGQAV